MERSYSIPPIRRVRTRRDTYEVRVCGPGGTSLRYEGEGLYIYIIAFGNDQEPIKIRLNGRSATLYI